MWSIHTEYHCVKSYVWGEERICVSTCTCIKHLQEVIQKSKNNSCPRQETGIGKRSRRETFYCMCFFVCLFFKVGSMPSIESNAVLALTSLRSRVRLLTERLRCHESLLFRLSWHHESLLFNTTIPIDVICILINISISNTYNSACKIHYFMSLGEKHQHQGLIGNPAQN